MPVVERFAPTWLLLSAGFDAHRDDPLTDLGLSAGDFAVLDRTSDASSSRPAVPWRCSKAATTSTPCDAAAPVCSPPLPRIDHVPESVTNGGPGVDVVETARARWVFGDLN